MNATVLIQQLERAKRCRTNARAYWTCWHTPPLRSVTTNPRLAPVKSNRPKRTSAEQAAKDEETLQGWERWQQEHANPQVKDYAESLGRKRTTVNGQIKRAQRNREANQEHEEHN